MGIYPVSYIFGCVAHDSLGTITSIALFGRGFHVICPYIYKLHIVEKFYVVQCSIIAVNSAM